MSKIHGLSHDLQKCSIVHLYLRLRKDQRLCKKKVLDSLWDCPHKAVGYDFTKTTIRLKKSLGRKWLMSKAMKSLQKKKLNLKQIHCTT